MKTLKVRWQRLVHNDETCPRCRQTEVELEEAISSLREALAPLGIDVSLEKEGITMAEFESDPLKSNRILINDVPLEEWLGARAGSSPCCDVCGPSECRTIEMDGETFEVIPRSLIYEAGLVCALKLL